MNALVVYDSRYGNTERIARAIADTLSGFGQARAVRAGETNSRQLAGADLLILGSPTQGWRPTTGMQSFLDSMPSGLSGLSVASFDTRFQWPSLVTGSAARRMAGKLRKMGTRLLLPPESFFVSGTEGPLKEGETERATDWARLVHEKYAARRSGGR